jgi:hypothetical protein
MKFADLKKLRLDSFPSDDLRRQAHLLDHELDAGVAPIVGFFLDASDG